MPDYLFRRQLTIPSYKNLRQTTKAKVAALTSSFCYQGHVIKCRSEVLPLNTQPLSKETVRSDASKDPVAHTHTSQRRVKKERIFNVQTQDAPMEERPAKN